MPPNLDIYILTDRRDRQTIKRFLDTYVDRMVCEDQQERQLHMVALRAHHRADEPRTDADWEWEPAQTLTHIIARGLDYPRRGFYVYLKAKVKSIVGATLGFTTDDRMVLGLSIDDAEQLPETECRAHKLMRQLAEAYDGRLGVIGVESPTPLSEREFRHKESAPFTIAFWQREL